MHSDPAGVNIPELKTHDTLNQEIWNGEVLQPRIRQALMRIAGEFIASLGLELMPDDVTLTGSMANYNYTDDSDLDLHLIFDFSVIDKNTDLVRVMLMAKKSLWNMNHQISVRGHEVEVYPQDMSEEHHSTGVYSILNDEWIHEPNASVPRVDMRAVKQKAADLMRLIDAALQHQDRLPHINNIREKIKKMRQCGLEETGEYSVENLAFKVLRRTGYLQKLSEAALQARDASLSVTQEGILREAIKANIKCLTHAREAM